MGTQTAPRSIDSEKMNVLLHQAVTDMGAAMHSVLLVIGDRLGLFRALSSGEPLTPSELSRRTGTFERYVREWLNANAAAKYIEYDPSTGTYFMTPEQAQLLSKGEMAMDLPGFYHMLASCMKDEEKITEVFRTGKGFGWHEHEKGLFEGCERFFRPNYLANLTTSWIPALDGVEAKLRAGARVADIGCGHGASTLLMAQTYPASEFFGFDYHDASIARACHMAEETGSSDHAHFEVAAAQSYPGGNYDFAACFDCLHDMGDPVGAARHVLQSLAKDGTWMIVEPNAADDTALNLNPVGRIFYSASTVCCVPASLAQEVGAGLGAQAGEKKIREVVMQGGFTRFRRATETPFNMVFEARP
ncbi:MAG TPA: methyltransferase domain-containing protein [Pseudacidobacterium sp.]|nr:methyltransferase domain-containing protein [Pseudacidobacterium sp.]